MANLGQQLDGGWLQNIPPNATPQAQNAALNDVINRLNTLLKTQVFADASNRRYISGFQQGGWPGGDFGMKISKPGIDVMTATTDQLLFSWDFTTGHTYHYGGTDFWYDPSTLKNYMQEGVMPDGTGGWAVADVGHDVSEGF